MIFMTGATGFVGSHTAEEFLRAGYRVRALVRPNSPRQTVPIGAEVIEGSLSDPESLKRGVEGCEGVIHIGGIVRAKSPDEFLKVNRDGVATLARISAEAGVSRFILCSSQAAGGPGTKTRRRLASDPPAPVTHYGRSKLAGEQALAQNAGPMNWAVVRPPAVYGPRDRAFFTFVQWVKWGFKLRLGDGGNLFAIIHAEDLARAMRAAYEAPKLDGNIWYATDGNDYTLFDMGASVEKAMKKQALWVPIPLTIAPVIATVIEFVAALGGKTALLSRQKVIELGQPAWTADDEPFRKATGFTPQFNLETGMAQTVEWYRKAKWI